jgi:hypothetical protein
VTQLELETGTNGQLNVRIDENSHKAIRYPSLPGRRPTLKIFKKNEVSFDSHICKSIYNASVINNMFIMKGIAGPGSISHSLQEM